MKKNIILGIMALGLAIGQDVYPGYVLYTPSAQTETYLMDIDSTIINVWQHANGSYPASMPYLINGDSYGIENTILVYPCRCENPIMENGGFGGRIIFYDWYSNILWDYSICNELYQAHHDISVLPNRNVLVNVWEQKSAEEAYSLGRTIVENPLGEVWSNAILEIQPNYETGDGTIVWEWHLWDHLIQDVNPILPNYGDIHDHPELYDINLMSMGTPSGSNGDWVHCNAIDYNESLDQFLLSYPGTGEIFIIDHSTTTEEAASHSGGVYGKGGDFLYRWGNPQNYDRGDVQDQILKHQHGVNWIKIDYPGSGNILIFNNSHLGQENSTILEIVTPIDTNGNYVIEGNSSYAPQTWFWLHYTNLYSPHQSGAFRLKNGNTFISLQEYNFLYEINSDEETVWSYQNNYEIHRAQKYDPNDFELECSIGDLNCDASLNILDIIQIVNLILIANYDVLGDLNEDEIVDILDIILLINIILDIDAISIFTDIDGNNLINTCE
jgi:hypothetical protein